MGEWWEANREEILHDILNGRRYDTRLCPNCNKIYYPRLNKWVDYGNDFLPEIREMISSKPCPKHHLLDLRNLAIRLQKSGLGDDCMMKMIEDRKSMEFEEKRRAQRQVA